MPFIGVQIPVGSYGDAYDAGLKVGLLMGGHLSKVVSLNGELNFELLNANSRAGDGTVTAFFVDALFSPLFHFGTPKIEGFVGPKLGYFGFSLSQSYESESASKSAHGLAYGLNAGLGFPVGNIAIGGMFSYVRRHAFVACERDFDASSQTCSSNPGGGDAEAVAFSALVLF